MYLIHAQLAVRRGLVPAPDTAALVAASARPEEGVEHVAFHPAHHPHPTLGLFVTGPSLEYAESAALAVCRRALARQPPLRGMSLVSCGAAFVAPWFERMLDGTGREGPGWTPCAEAGSGLTEVLTPPLTGGDANSRRAVEPPAGRQGRHRGTPGRRQPHPTVPFP